MKKYRLSQIERGRRSAVIQYIRQCTGPGAVTFHPAQDGGFWISAPRDADLVFAYLAWA